MLPAAALGLAVIALTANWSAAAASRSPTPSKRGIASAKYEAADPQKLSRLGASWAYDWSATPPPKDRHLQGVPMAWGGGSITNSTITTLTRARRSGRARYLLGFNEPDNAGQANMTPAEAAALWPKLERTGLILGSPAPAVPTDGWLARFITIARRRHLRVNFIALHYYQDFTDPSAVSELKSQLIAIHRQFGKPIWITEIGAMDIRQWGEPMLHGPTRTRAVGYMRRSFAMLDKLSFVRRYAWFTDECWSDSGCHASSLFDASGHVTAVGRAFRTAA